MLEPSILSKLIKDYGQEKREVITRIFIEELKYNEKNDLIESLSDYIQKNETDYKAKYLLAIVYEDHIFMHRNNERFFTQYIKTLFPNEQYKNQELFKYSKDYINEALFEYSIDIDYYRVKSQKRNPNISDETIEEVYVELKKYVDRLKANIPGCFKTIAGKNSKEKELFIKALWSYHGISVREKLIEDMKKNLLGNDYPNKLLGLANCDDCHYKYHPEMLPFVGKNYKKGGVLIVAESHYIDKGFDVENSNIYKSNKWYGHKYDDILKNVSDANDLWVCCKTWFWTISVLTNYLYFRSGRIFTNMMVAIGNNEENIQERIIEFSYMNYFQIPANNATTINYSDKDKEIAYDTLCKVIKELKPEKIIFVTRKAFDCFSELDEKINKQNKDDFIPVFYTNHPSRRGWNNENFGKKHFRNAFLDRCEPDYKYFLENLCHH